MRPDPDAPARRGADRGDGTTVPQNPPPPRIVAPLAALLAIAALTCLPACAAAGGSAHSRAARHSHQHSALVRARSAAGVAEGIAGEYRQLTSEIVTGYGSSGEHSYANGLWENGDPSCWYCNVGPAVGAAYLAGTMPAMFEVAVASFDRAIGEQRLANGSFAGPSPPIVSAAFAIMLGLAYVRLEPQLDAATRSLWQGTLAGIADFLISDRDVTWYANGNINASYAAAIYFAWRATGAQKYEQAYDAEIQFMMAPTGHLWEGFGLTLTQQPSKLDGSDGSGFLTEGSPPGWDPEYSHLQLDFLSALYSASGDPRVLRLLNLILNQELTRVDPSTFMLDARQGTRKSAIEAFTSAALPLLVLEGKRPDLARLLPAAFARLSGEYHATLKYTQHNYYRGVALWLGPILLATSGLPASSIPVPSTGVGVGAAPPRLAPAASTPSATRPSNVRHTPTQAPSAAAQSGPPAVSPHVLGAAMLRSVQELEIPHAEYAFATPSALTHGVITPRTAGARVALAAFVCTHVCKLAIRPLLVIHRGGAGTAVAVQRDLPATTATLTAGQVLVSRVSVTAAMLSAARSGGATFLRLRLTLLGGRRLEGRSGTFRLAWR
jgi:hypothetical protein